MRYPQTSVAHPSATVNSLRRSHIRNLKPPAPYRLRDRDIGGADLTRGGGASRGAQILQSVPLSWNAAGGALLRVLLPVKPMVTDADGAMVRS